MNKFVITLLVAMSVLLAVASFGLWRIDTELSAIREQVARVGLNGADQLNCGRAEAARDAEAVGPAMARIAQDLGVVSSKLDEHNALVNRTFESLLPYKLSSEIEARIQTVKDRIEKAIESPIDSAAIEQLRVDLSSVADELPPRAQEEAIPRLMPLRWNLEALWSLADVGGSQEEDIEASLRNLDGLLEYRPSGSSDSLASRLESYKLSKEEKIAAADRSRAFALAAQKGNSGDTSEMTEAISALAPYADDVQAQELTSQIKTKLARGLVSQAADELNKALGEYKSLPSAGMRQYAFARAGQTAIELRLQMISSGISDAPLSRRLQNLQETVRRLEAKEAEIERKAHSQNEAQRRKRYQVWALQQMAKVKSLEALKNSGLTDARARYDLRQAMTAYLAPIDESLLDIAVGQWFQKVYSNRFVELADDGKRKLIGSFASTPKMTLESLP